MQRNENPPPPPPPGGRRRRSAKQGAWMAHVKATMRAHKGMKLKQVLKLAKKTYKKTMRGGSLVMQPHPVDTAPMVGARRTRRRRGGNGNLY